MYAVISTEKIQLPAGSVVRLPGTWQDYCKLRDSRGDSSIPRIKFRNGEILLMSPLPKQGREANILSDIVKALLDSQNRNYEAFTPITMDLPEEGGIEPDYCFYIDNWQASVGKDRIDWRHTPPPDLVIEIDVTSYTAAADYLPYKVPEVWLFRKTGLQIYSLETEGYQPQLLSRYFPDLELPKLVEWVLQMALEQGTGMAIREFRRTLMT
ncbi:Uma2 family endonuclease [Lyngbya sp. CCY1209]|jgi:Uma2 family endonuclease|uniref:Uma2 family endonuclease n=1 Tax=Lyngbya sp. CCY1209 TaxID=2886103 RepID=UPI002D20EBAF|nr:Uma2 family endonuclease [Lyngbya sp. CCY1209]MEB3885623.1 Uma2 family endonuclease [Lyngbya sp. CCY1209]